MTIHCETTDGTRYTIRYVEWWRRIDHSTIEVKTYGNIPTLNRKVSHVTEALYAD